MFNNAYMSAVLTTHGEFMLHYLCGLTITPGEFNTMGVISWNSNLPHSA